MLLSPRTLLLLSKVSVILPSRPERGNELWVSNVEYLTGVVQELRLMRIQILDFLRTVETNVFPPNNLCFSEKGHRDIWILQ